MVANILWLSLAKAAEFLDVSKDTVLRRAVEWSDEPVPGKVRTKYLVLGTDTRSDRRYYSPDLERWLYAKPSRNLNGLSDCDSRPPNGMGRITLSPRSLQRRINTAVLRKP
jgi:hypothetical protein